MNVMGMMVSESDWVTPLECVSQRTDWLLIYIKIAR